MNQRTMDTVVCAMHRHTGLHLNPILNLDEVSTDDEDVVYSYLCWRKMRTPLNDIMYLCILHLIDSHTIP